MNLLTTASSTLINGVDIGAETLVNKVLCAVEVIKFKVRKAAVYIRDWLSSRAVE